MRSRRLLPLLLTVLLAVGCSSDPAPRQVVAPDGPAEVEPPPPLVDVAGVLDEVTVADLSITGSGLYPDGSDAEAAVPVDQEAVDAAVDAAVAWLDAHLTEVQSGGPGRVVDAGLTGDATAVSGGLTGPEHPVVDASYVLTVGARGTPEWLRASTTVTREDGTMTATFVFLPDGDGVDILAVQVGDGTPAPIGGTSADDAAADS